MARHVELDNVQPLEELAEHSSGKPGGRPALPNGSTISPRCAASDRVRPLMTCRGRQDRWVPCHDL
jgi:hypothetical protein